MPRNSYLLDRVVFYELIVLILSAGQSAVLELVRLRGKLVPKIKTRVFLNFFSQLLVVDIKRPRSTFILKKYYFLDAYCLGVDSFGQKASFLDVVDHVASVILKDDFGFTVLF